MRLYATFFLLTISVTSLVTAPAVSVTAEQTNLNQSSNTLTVAGLRDRVIVTRDERGIPYIEAENDDDLYFTQGYVTASDRLWQMDLLRRTERGELAEILGSAALEQDKQHRILGLTQVVNAEIAQAAPLTRALLEAYARGVNAYMASLDGRSLPPEFQILQYKPKPWTPADSLLVGKSFAEALSNTWRLDLMRSALAQLPSDKRFALMPESSPLDVLVVGTDSNKTNAARPSGGARDALTEEILLALAHDEQIAVQSLARVGVYAEGLAASNNWVVDGKHTDSGKPLLANDPHLQATAPSIWYMVHLSAPGLRVAGVSAPGGPGVIIGHNDRIAWGMTNVGPDVQDVYEEKFDPENAKRYLTPVGWRVVDVRHEEIKVRKSFTEATTETVPLDVSMTRHGPIVFEKAGKRYALRWTALDPVLNTPDSVYFINRAHNWKEFSAALKSFTAPTQNIVYADTAGHIGYHAAGVVPIRRSGDGSIPYDGSTDAGDWVKFIPLDKLPTVYDPPSGIIVTANQRIVGADYPFFLTHSWAQPYRARRIYDLLTQKPKLTIDDFRRIQGDVYSIGNVLFARQSAKILRPNLTAADAGLKGLLDAFDRWDGMVAADSRVAPLVAQMRIAFRSRILTAALGEELVKVYQWSNFDTTIDRIMMEQPRDWLPKEFSSYPDLLRACYEDARKTLTKNLGEDESKWTWGEMVKINFRHPLAAAPLIGLQFTVPPIPQNGSGGMAATVNVGANVSMRLIADLSDWDNTQQGITLGESGIPSSPHWKDQLADWRAVTPRTFPFTEPAIKKAAAETLTLVPK
ncbi:MAG TPA: penicillin acylase family protein [Pyrinomonadaceae bacterium]|nr:penicillin acylase family protein [Pyrinomonadaceae bacterium]